MKRILYVLTALMLGLTSTPLYAFCGFYVAKADTQLFNKASQVVLARDGERTVITMSNDFQGDVQEFATVIPVPTVLQREQIHVTERAVLEHLDAYSSPRLVEYYDENPCEYRQLYEMEDATAAANAPAARKSRRERADSLGVSIEAEYTVGEYDILILSAKQSDGLITWLTESGYRLPQGADPVIKSYLKQDMKFFVAKVNLEAQQKLGFAYLRPLQVAFESPKFMLPIRLGTLNANGTQDLYVFALSPKGRVETVNYRTVKMPSNVEIPVHVKDDFARFYQDMFARQVEKENGRAVFIEYAWDMNWCDPCAADPLSDAELRELGVFWLDQRNFSKPGILPRRPQPAARNVFITRLHVRYDQEHFPDDLRFQATNDRSNFQGRYIIRHPWDGEASCRQAKNYFTSELPQRFEREATTLASLTGWEIRHIRNKMDLTPDWSPEPVPWWKSLWQDS